MGDCHQPCELTPEFFFSPYFLVNGSGFSLPKSAHGSMSDNVELPAWAHSPREFVAVHRRALESAPVSAALPDWIDCIFGIHRRSLERFTRFKDGLYDDQPGANVTEILGAVPAQLFTQPHPKRHRPVQKKIEAIVAVEKVVGMGNGHFLTSQGGLVRLEDGSKKTIRGIGRTDFVAFSRTAVISVSADGRFVNAWDVNSGTRGVVGIQGALVRDFCVTGECLLIGGSDSVVAVWGISDLRLRHRLVTGGKGIVAVAGSFTLDLVVSVDESDEVVVTSLLSGKVMNRFELPTHGLENHRMRITEDGCIVFGSTVRGGANSLVSAYDMYGRMLFVHTVPEVIEAMEAVHTDDFYDFVVLVTSEKVVWIVDCGSGELTRMSVPEIVPRFLAFGRGNSIAIVKQKGEQHVVEYCPLTDQNAGR
jgi:hypothetical protein